jgi:diguanylate cyclase (GGDEF)-like protein
MAGRMGGDEFAILVEGDEEQTQLIAEEFKNRYGRDVEKPENGKLKERNLAFSVGHSNLSDEDVADFSSLLRHADLDMYEDKQSKMGELTTEQELGLLAAKHELDTSDIRLRDAPKLWRQRGLL